jgi:hypothetical protein
VATADGVAVFGLLANAGLPRLAGPWFINGDEATRIQQNGTSLTFTNEAGNSSPGTFLSSTQVVATGWGNLVGTLVPTADGMRIAWANGTAWDQPQLAGQGFINGDLSVQIAQADHHCEEAKPVNQRTSK